MNWLVQILADTNSRFWRTYEWASFAILLVLFVCVLVFYFGENPKVGWALTLLLWSFVGIVFVDNLKYRFTGASKDKPLRKWFSFRWAQKFRPEEVFILPNDFQGELTDLKISRCNRCGTYHGFLREKNDSERICSFHGCKELVSVSDEYVLRTSHKFRKKEERSVIFAEVRSLPFRFLYRYFWVIAEHIFKLLSWMLLACAVLAGGQHIENDTIEYAGIFFCVLWIINFFVISFKATIFVQDELIIWSKKDEIKRNIKEIIAFIVSMILVLFMLQFVVLTLNLISEVYTHINFF